jgi:hypothetical protein
MEDHWESYGESRDVEYLGRNFNNPQITQIFADYIIDKKMRLFLVLEPPHKSPKQKNIARRLAKG